jgi:hypothetical protein
MITHALRYALAGLAVLPLRPNTKIPFTAHGASDATTDVETIGDWWTETPTANIGIRLGDSLVCFDVDTRKGAKIETLLNLGIVPQSTISQRTASGGWHVIFQKPTSIELSSTLPGIKNIDVLSGNRYIVASPSTIDGKPYLWNQSPIDFDPERIPLWIAERLQKRQPIPQSRNNTTPRDGIFCKYSLQGVERLLSRLDPWSFDYHTWVQVLMAVHWAYPGEDGLAVAEAWAAGEPGEVRKKWKSFKSNQGVTIGTLDHVAKEFSNKW